MRHNCHKLGFDKVLSCVEFSTTHGTQFTKIKEQELLSLHWEANHCLLPGSHVPLQASHIATTSLAGKRLAGPLGSRHTVTFFSVTSWSFYSLGGISQTSGDGTKGHNQPGLPLGYVPGPRPQCCPSRISNWQTKVGEAPQGPISAKANILD